MSKIYFVFLAFLIVISSCDNEAAELDNSKLIGEWNWISTDGGIAFHIHETPLSTGKNLTLKFTEDYKYSIVENDIVVATGTYELSLKESIYSGKKELFISSSNTEYVNQYLVITGILKNLNDNSLEITDNMHDGVGSGYKRLD